MLATANMKDCYEKIQKQLFYMIPEKWDRVYLYASVVDRFNGLQTGEMFFYYFPKSMIKKNPINVYEVPNKFNIDENAYLKLAEKLYDEIKNLRKELITIGERPWSSITISIENFKFNAVYNYDNLQDPKYTSYDRHLIWRYQYLGIPLSSYSKKERKMIEEYLSQNRNNYKNTYQEGIYQKPVSHIKEYNKQYVKEESKYDQTDDNVREDAKSSPSKYDTNIEQNIKSQILNIKP